MNKKRIEYVTAPEIKEAKDLLVRVRDFYTYSMFDILKLGIPESEQLSKSLSKVTNLAHQAAGPIETYLTSADRDLNLKKEIEPRGGFVALLVQQFGTPPESPSKTNFVLKIRRLGRFIFTEAERAEYFNNELDSLVLDFYSKKLDPYVLKYNIKH